MLCPKCNKKLFCYDSRPLDEYTIYRKRVCRTCHYHYMSIEALDKKPFKKAALKPYQLRERKGR